MLRRGQLNETQVVTVDLSCEQDDHREDQVGRRSGERDRRRGRIEGRADAVDPPSPLPLYCEQLPETSLTELTRS